MASSNRKADCTPEEWAEHLRRQNERRRARKAAGIIYPSESPDRVREVLVRWREKNAGTDRMKFLRHEYWKRTKASAKAKQNEWKRNNPDKMREYRRRYVEKMKRGHIAATPMTGDRVWQMTLEALRGKYDEPTRMDIAGEAMLAFLEGDAPNIKDAVALGMKRHWKMFSKFSTRSLDAEIAEGLRLIDLIADDAPRAGYAE